MKRKLIVPMILLLLVGCAVTKRASQLTPTTQWALNTADQLHQAESDYRAFFTDLGDAQRQTPPVFTVAQIAVLNGIGHRAKTAIEAANRSFKTWQANPTDSGRQLVITALSAAQAILLELSTQKSQMVNGGVK